MADDDLDFLESNRTGSFEDMGVSGLDDVAEMAMELEPEAKAEAAPEEAPTEEPKVVEAAVEEPDEEGEEAVEVAPDDLLERYQKSLESAEVEEVVAPPAEDPRDELVRQQTEALKAIYQKVSGDGEVEEEQESKVEELLSSPAMQAQIREIMEEGDEAKLLPLMGKVARMAAEETTAGEVQRLSMELRAMRAGQEMAMQAREVTSRVESSFIQAKSRSPLHAALVDQLMDSNRGQSSILAKEIEAIGDSNQRAALLSNPLALTRFLDGVAYDVQLRAGQMPAGEVVESVTSDVAETTAVPSRSANKGQKIGKKKTKAPTEDEIDKELFGEEKPISTWEMMQTSRGM